MHPPPAAAQVSHVPPACIGGQRTFDRRWNACQESSCGHSVRVGIELAMRRCSGKASAPRAIPGCGYAHSDSTSDRSLSASSLFAGFDRAVRRLRERASHETEGAPNSRMNTCISIAGPCCPVCRTVHRNIYSAHPAGRVLLPSILPCSPYCSCTPVRSAHSCSNVQIRWIQGFARRRRSIQ